MAKKQRKGRYHPSRVSGNQKFLIQKDFNNLFKKIKRPFEIIKLK
jgi:hypothetical protein